MATVGQLIYEVGADTAKAHSNVTALHQEFGRAPGILGIATGAMAGFVAGGALLSVVSTGFGFVKDAIGDMVGKAAESQSVMANTNAVLKSTHGQAGMTAQAVSALADQYMSLTGIDDEVVQSTENMLLTFTNISSKVFPQATLAALNMATSLKTDPVQASIMLGKALNDPVRGMTALMRVGVTFDEQQQKAIRTAMAHHDILGAQNIVLQELSKEFGGQAAVAGETYAGKMAILSGKLDNVKEALGAKLLPILSQAVDRFMPLIDVADNILPPILDNLIGLFSGGSAPIAALGAVLQSNLAPAASLIGSFFQTTLVPAFSQLQDIGWQILPTLIDLGHTFTGQILPAVLGVAHIFITQLLPTMMQIWITVATNLLPVLLSLAGMLLGQVVPAVLHLVAAVAPVLVPVLQVLGFVLGNVVVPVLGILINVLVTVIGWITNLIGWIGNAGAAVSGWGAGWTAFVGVITGAVMGGFNTIRGIIQGAVSFVTGLFVQLYNHNIYFKMLVDIIRQQFDNARSFIMSIWSGITGWLGTQFNLIRMLASTAFNNAVAAIRGAIGAAGAAARSVADAALAPITGLGGRLFAAAKAAVQMIVDGIRSMIGRVASAAGDVDGAIWKNLGFHSPTEEGPGADADVWMSNLGKMLASGLQGQRSAVGNAALALTGDVADALSGGSATAGLAIAGSRSSAGSSAAGGPAGGSGSSAGRPIYLVMDDAGRPVVAKGIIEDVVAELQRAGVKTGT